MQSARFFTHELTQQPVAFVFMVTVDDIDPLSIINRLRLFENLPRQYVDGVYDSSPANTKSFVFVLNDQEDDATCKSSIKRINT